MLCGAVNGTHRCVNDSGVFVRCLTFFCGGSASYRSGWMCQWCSALSLTVRGSSYYALLPHADRKRNELKNAPVIPSLTRRRLDTERCLLTRKCDVISGAAAAAFVSQRWWDAANETLRSTFIRFLQIRVCVSTEGYEREEEEEEGAASHQVETDVMVRNGQILVGVLVSASAHRHLNSSTLSLSSSSPSSLLSLPTGLGMPSACLLLRYFLTG